MSNLVWIESVLSETYSHDNKGLDIGALVKLTEDCIFEAPRKILKNTIGIVLGRETCLKHSYLSSTDLCTDEVVTSEPKNYFYHMYLVSFTDPMCQKWVHENRIEFL